MGFHATIGNSQKSAPHVSAHDRRARTDAGTYAVQTEEFDPITDDGPTLAPNYSRGHLPARGTSATGQTIVGAHLSNGVAFRKVSANREELRTDNGVLILRKVTRKDVAAWIGEFKPFASKVAVVLVYAPIIKGDPPVKGDARDLLITRATLSEISIY
jgi:hypothetical protein